MANKKIIGTANLIYSMPNIRSKNEVQAVASILLRAPENYDINAIEDRVDTERMKELARGNFITQQNENEYKRIIAVVSSVVNGHNDIIQADIFDDGEIDINTDELIKAGKAGKLKLYRYDQ